MSVMASPGEAKLPPAYRNLNNERNVQAPQNCWNRISGGSSEVAADFAHALNIDAKYRIPIADSRSRNTKRGYAEGTIPSIRSVDKSGDRAWSGIERCSWDILTSVKVRVTWYTYP